MRDAPIVRMVDTAIHTRKKKEKRMTVMYFKVKIKGRGVVRENSALLSLRLDCQCMSLDLALRAMQS